MFSNGLQHMDTPVMADQQKLTYIISVWMNLSSVIADRDGWREREESMLSVCYDDGSEIPVNSIV